MLYFKLYETWGAVVICFAGVLLGGEGGAFLSGTSLYWVSRSIERKKDIDFINRIKG